MVAILVKFSSFSQNVEVSIAAKFVFIFCYLKANFTSIYSYVKVKKWRFLSWYRALDCAKTCKLPETSKLAETGELVGTGRFAGICRALERIIKAWKRISATINPMALPCSSCALVIWPCEHVFRAISSLIKKDE